MEKKCKVCGTTEKVSFDGMCKKCYEDSIVIVEKEEVQDAKKSKEQKSFWKDKKNIAIVVLSFIIVCFLFSSNDTEVNELRGQLEEKSSQMTELNKQLDERELQVTNLQDENKKLLESSAQITELQASNETLQSEKETLEGQKSQLEQEKATLQTQNQELNARVEELQRISSSQTTSAKQSSTTVAASTTPSATVSNAPTGDTNSEMVYITDTGKKYHSGGCSYLRSSKHEISKSSAISQGYTACSRCNP